MINYTNSKVYKLESFLTTDICIGRTTKKYLSQRVTYYHLEYKKYKLGKTEFYHDFMLKLFHLFDVYNINSFKIIIIC